MTQGLRFHWSLSQAGDKFRRAQSAANQSGLLSLPDQIALCRRAEQCGIDSMLMAIGFARPDPLVLSVAIGRRTERIKFMVACRSGLVSPAYFVQQVNTASTLVDGRVCVNIVCGHTPHELRYYGDTLSHDERYERTGEFLSICRAFWESREPVNFSGKYYRIENGRIHTPFVSPDRLSPEIFLGGNSALAEDLAVRHAACLWRFPDRPEKLAPEVSRVLNARKQVGLLVSLIARPTREQALQAACELVKNFGAETRSVHQEFAKRSDSTGFRSMYALSGDGDSAWLTPCLWTGAVPFLGAPAIALVGSFEEVASALLEYKALGVSQYLFMGWPDVEEMTYFGEGVLPIVRAREREAACAAVAS